ncbi:ATP-binding cassette subfamily B protein/ATP-binding cassette subfamily C protein/ATP-binding cassette subfamily B multidrug efflux pump [Pseudoduganella flava]|uniref:ATP-binding cassette domain-containing protein n=1 Tax=Pseudoduganella flava TaxID=871742 RepID=A0A562PV80_9BURK|nr:ABC transporter transmembrane domain-containing protein [Pseudoduganella flava]QGZ39441.1 ATP-binding cassette domain-containing protein [Pseudoduganella flava]TWI48319.1 ATP-binding cassette subfamily B protein/ATP-binding cassette subfamily C protein/ATP-binding cassette subfamily B multidrug efflux pump [Pseudoduganella flava]
MQAERQERAHAQQMRQAVGLLRDSAGPDLHHLWWAVLWLACAAGLEVVAPLLGKRLIDDYLLPRVANWPAMALLLGGVFVTGAIATWLRYLQLVRLSGLAMRSVQRLRERVYGHVLRLPMAFFDRAITGQLVSRVTNDTEAVKQLYVQVLFVILDSTIVLTGMILAMAWLDWRLMSIVVATMPFVLLIVLLYQRLSAPAVTKARQLRSDINAQMAESIGGMSVLQANNAQRRFGERFARTNDDHYTQRVAEIRANAWLLRPALDMLNVVLLASVIWLFGLRAGGAALGAAEVGVLYAFISYIARVIEPLIQITMQFSQLQQSVVATARVAGLLDEPGAPEHGKCGDGAANEAGDANAPAIDIRHLDFAYVDDNKVLHDVTLQIPQGAFYGIVGHTGSGKSTLLSLLLRYYPARPGSILMSGVPLDEIDHDTFRSRVGLVPQDPFLLAASARENIDMGRNLPFERIERAARAAHAHDFILALENGYDTVLGEGGSRLSSGQKQLIAIARALAGEPRILMLDEATSRIDSATEQIVQEALDELRGQVTIIAIAHRLSTIRDADRIVVLNHGRIEESGSHDALMRIEGGLYQRLYLLQQLAA